MNIHFNAQHQNPTVVDGMRVPYPPEKRHFPRLRWILVLLIVISPIVFVVWTYLSSLVFFETTGAVVFREVQVNTYEAGVIENIIPGQGDRVAAGAAFAKIRRTDPEVRPEGVPMSENDLAYFDSLVQLARGAEQKAGEALAAREKLLRAGAATAVEVAEARERLDAAAGQRLRAEIERNEAYRQNALIAQRMEQARTPADREVTVEAPVSGIVLSLKAAPGNYAARGSVIASLAEEGSVRIACFVESKDAEWILAKKNAEISFAGSDVRYACAVQLAPAPEMAASPAAPEQGTSYTPLNLVPLQEIPLQYAQYGYPCRIHFGARKNVIR